MYEIDDIITQEIQNDKWLLFHGTTNVYQDSISTSGLEYGTSFFTISELNQVANVFDCLKWVGNHPGGYPILRAFSINSDHSDHRGKPLFLAESALRASLYATGDFAGGEICRAIYHSINDIQSYIENKKIRDEHHEYLSNKAYEESMMTGRNIEPEELPSLDWVSSEHEKITVIYKKTLNIRSKFEHGLIYLVRLNKQNLSNIEYCKRMGIKCFRPIFLDELEDVYIIPNTYSYPEIHTDHIRISKNLGMSILGEINND